MRKFLAIIRALITGELRIVVVASPQAANPVSMKQKLLCAISVHPKLAAFVIGLTITIAVGIAIGMLDHRITSS